MLPNVRPVSVIKFKARHANFKKCNETKTQMMWKEHITDHDYNLGCAMENA